MKTGLLKLISMSAMAIMIVVAGTAFADNSVRIGINTTEVKIANAGGCATWSSGRRSLDERNGIAYVVYDGSGGVVEFARSDNGGAYWSKSLTIGPGWGAGLAVGPISDVKPDTAIHIVHSGYNENIFYSTSIDEGSTWATEVVNGTYPSGYTTTVAVNQSHGSVYIAWDDGYIVYMATNETGQWVVHKVSSTSRVDELSLAVDEAGIVHIAWYDVTPGVSNIFYKNYNGISWSAIKTVNMPGTGHYPSLAASNSHVCVTWNNYYGSETYATVSCSHDNGSTWNQITEITDMISGDEFMSIAVAPNGNISVALVEDNAPRGIYMSRSINNNNNYTSYMVTDKRGSCPSITLDDEGKAIIIWSSYHYGAVNAAREQ